MMASYNRAGGDHLTGPHCSSENLMEKKMHLSWGLCEQASLPQPGRKEIQIFLPKAPGFLNRKEEDLLRARHGAAPQFPSSQEPRAVWHLSCFCS